MHKFLILILILICSSSCVAVKGYDKVYLNDGDMQLSARASERFETNFQLYREASSGANGGKTGGGCGCN
ncbi:hypothetical protein MTsPCn9_30800 [Croceitalea sp. MTPC9]|uniref:DUF4266 domain-containing protein n=1 Tax=unclassified Croceitalea TaxID=2632280 RepID=UPI002B3ACB41|nr:hypothetical protein MTsPCn6_20850 [Croceitalea sp. MTPC6]GMN18140.1 hypothetical protein MTsPCn9_30800 [Croceitalea sp. MTPC9]